MIKIKLQSRNFEKLQSFSAFSTKSEKIRANFIKISKIATNLDNIANVLAFLTLKTPEEIDKIC